MSLGPDHHRKTRFGGSFSFLLAAMLLAGCGSGEDEGSAALLEIGEVSSIDAPAEIGSYPHVAPGPESSLLMSWLSPADDGRHSVMFARLDGESWTEPVAVASGDDFFVNWADFPSIAAAEDGTLFAHWLKKSGEGTYSYDVMMSRSNDGGTTWSEPAVLHDDGVDTEHGFVSMQPLGGDRMAVVWLNGRNMGGGGHGHGGEGAMTARFAIVHGDGRISERQELDARVCECCQTSLARIDDETLIALFRNRSDDEIRDIGYTVYDGESWSETKTVNQDGWEIFGCPVNGPAVTSLGEGVLGAAWFTAASELERVQVAFSTDRGESFERPVRVDLGSPLGRVDVTPAGRDAVLVTWLERIGSEQAAVMVRSVRLDGTMTDPVEIGRTSSARASGFPRIVTRGGDRIVAYTVPMEEGNQLRMARLSLREVS